MLVTGGCGMSQESFELWRTWPSFCNMTHHCDHSNVGVPAGGNKLIGRTLLHKIYSEDVDVCIVTWTSIGKEDFYIEKADIADEIRTYNLRNFLVDIRGNVVSGEGFWPSSVSDDNRIKEWYTRNLASKFNSYYELLESILFVQSVVKEKGISLYMFFSYVIDFEYIIATKELSTLWEQVDKKSFVTDQFLANQYQDSKWKHFQKANDYGLVPVIGWQWDFYEQYIIPILDNHYDRKNVNLDKLRDGCYALCEKNYTEGIS